MDETQKFHARSRQHEPARCARQRSRVLSLSLLALAGCSGAIVAGDGEPPGAGPGAGGRAADVTGMGGAATPPPAVGFACEPGLADRASPRPGRMRRLGATALRNTLRDLATELLGDARTAESLLAVVRAPLETWPRDERKALPGHLTASFARLDQVVSQQHVDAAYAVATQLGRALVEGGRLGAVVGPCATDGDASNDERCLQTFLSRFAALAMRRPPTATELDFYRRRFYGQAATASREAYADLIAALLLSPQFLYHVEHGTEAVPGSEEVFALSAHELASRLSYHLWETMPDAELREAASSGALLTAAGLAAQVDRMLTDPRAVPVVDTFYAEWLRLPDLPRLDQRTEEPLFRAFAARHLPSAMLREAMADEILAMTRHFTLEAPGSVQELLTTDQVFARSAELAEIYGVAPWDGHGTPPSLAPGSRPGLLTRAAFHVTGNAQTRPVIKGVFVRDTLLCDEVPPVPEGVMPVEPELSPELTTRQVVEAITEAPGSVCKGCHETFINPIGFATENIDALGRLRGEQVLYDESGTEVARVPVDTRAVPQIVLGDETAVDGPAGLVERIVASGKVPACLARQMYRYAFATAEDEALDACTLERLRAAAAGRAGLPDLFRQVVLSPAFAHRLIHTSP